MSRSVVHDSNLYFLDGNDDKMVIAKADMDKHERQDIGTLVTKISNPLLVPFDDTFFLFGDRAQKCFGLMCKDTNSPDGLKTFNHKYIVSSPPSVHFFEQQ